MSRKPQNQGLTTPSGVLAKLIDAVFGQFVEQVDWDTGATIRAKTKFKVIELAIKAKLNGEQVHVHCPICTQWRLKTGLSLDDAGYISASSRIPVMYLNRYTWQTDHNKGVLIYYMNRCDHCMTIVYVRG